MMDEKMRNDGPNFLRISFEDTNRSHGCHDQEYRDVATTQLRQRFPPAA